jgi:hypothetical protein
LYVEIDEDKDGEDEISEQCKSGSDATAKDEIDSSEEEDDELTLGAEVCTLYYEHLVSMLMPMPTRKTAAKFMAPSA